MKIQQYIYFLREKKVSQSTPTTGSNMFVLNKQNASGRKHTGPPNTDAVFDLESQWFCVNICPVNKCKKVLLFIYYCLLKFTIFLSP